MGGSWRTGVQNIGNDFSNVFKTALNKTKDYYGTRIKNTIEQAETMFKNGVNVVGINVAGIEDMKTAIDTYLEGVGEALNVFTQAGNETSTAFAGQYATEIRGYIEACKAACLCIVSNMAQFKLELNKVKEAYVKQDVDEVSARIKSDAEETRSAYTMHEKANFASTSSGAAAGAAAGAAGTN